MPGPQNPLPVNSTYQQSGPSTSAAVDAIEHSQNAADLMDFDEIAAPVDASQAADKKEKLIHADFYNNFGDLFGGVKI